MPAMWALTLALLTAMLIQPTGAVFGLPSKRFRYEGLIDAGSLGLDAIDGQVVAFGDWNADSAWVRREGHLAGVRS